MNVLRVFKLVAGHGLILCGSVLVLFAIVVLVTAIFGYLSSNQFVIIFAVSFLACCGGVAGSIGTLILESAGTNRIFGVIPIPQ